MEVNGQYLKTLLINSKKIILKFLPETNIIYNF